MKLITKLKFKLEVWNRKRKLRKKNNKPKPGTIHIVGNRRYYVHEKGQLERIED